MLKRLKVIAVAVLALVAGRAFGSIDTVDGIDWWFEVRNGTVVIQSTIPTQTSAIDPSTAGAIKVPSVLGGYPVTAIGLRAFYRCRNLTSVSIPAGVTRIDNEAFYECSTLESVSLPDGVTSVGASAFHSCGKLRECELPASVRTIGNSAFEYCSSLPNVVFKERVDSVGNFAFSSCGALQSVTFQGEVGTIGSSAFSSCGALQSVTFMGDVGTIGSSAFSNCDALQRVVSEGVVVSLGDSAFFKCTKLNDVVFEKDVGSIGTTAFYGCTSLTNVHFSAGLGGMADYVFGNCEALPVIDLPEGVTNLAEGVFYNCRAFTSIAFPESMSFIPDNALAGCANLTNVTFTENVKAVGIGAFLNCSKFMDFTLPRNLERIEKRAFEGTAFWQVQADGVVEKDGYFLGIKGPCPSRVEIPAGTKTIVANMFRDCTNLVEIVLPQGLVSIGDYAFYNTGLRSVTFPPGLENVGERAFAESRNLARVSNASGFWCGEGAFEHTGLATVSVGFDANRGWLAASETNKSFAVGVPYGAMPVPTRSSSYNYQFAGWHTAAKGGALVSETNVVSDTLTMLYAHWQTDYPFTYYVRFYADSEATDYSGSQTMTNGVMQVLRKNDFISKPGYLFAGWTTVRGGAVVYSDGDAIAESLTTESGESVPLYACWMDNAYDVMDAGKDFGVLASFPVRWTGRLDSETLQSGDRRQTISFKVGSSRKADILARGLEGSSIPTIELWRKFPSATSVWERVCSVYSTAAASCDFTKDAQYQLRLTSSTLTKGCLVYSIGIGTAVDIYFDPDGGSGGGARPYIANLPYGVLPTATRSECDFEGWYTKGGALIRESATVSSSVTNLIAHWAMRHTYYVAFNANGGQGMMEQVAHRYGETFALPVNAFVRDRYRFDGWALTEEGPVVYTDGAEVSDLVPQSGGKLELYAVWSRIREAVDFPIANGSVTNDIGAVSVISNSLIFTGTLSAATNRHYLVFTAADSDVCRLAVDPKTGLRRGAELRYGSVLVTDLATTSQELTFERGDTVCLVVECGLKGAEIYEYEVSVGTVGRTVSYDLNGGVLVGRDKSYGTNFDFTEGTPVGYFPMPTNMEDEVYFLGWYDAKTNLVDAAELVPPDGLVLTARWTEPPPYEYTIRFDGNGAAGAMPDMKCSSDVEFSLPSNAFSWAGCAFKGWARSQNGDVEYDDSAKIDSPLVKKKDSRTPLVLYARWSGEDGVEIEQVDGVFWHYRIVGDRAEVANILQGREVAAIDVNTAGEITVPSELGGIAVLAVGRRAFAGCGSLTSVVLPKGLESIGDYAFENCPNLKSVKFMGARPTANPNVYAGASKALQSLVRPSQKASWVKENGMLPQHWPEKRSDGLEDYKEYLEHSRRINWWRDPAAGDDGDVDFGDDDDFDDQQDWDDDAYDASVSHVYDGYLLDGGVVVGKVQVKAGAGRHDQADDETDVGMTATVVLLGEGGTVSLKGSAEGVDEFGGSGELVSTKRKDGREMSVMFDADGMFGDFDGFDIVGARNVFGKRTSADKRAALAAMDICGGTRSVILRTDGDSPFASGYAVLTVAVSSGGKAKVSGVLPDGTKVSVASQLMVFEDHCELPVVAPLYSGKRGGLGFAVVYPQAEGADAAAPFVDGLSDWVADPGKATGFVAQLTEVGVGTAEQLPGRTPFSVTERFAADGADIDDSLLPVGVEVTPDGSKWRLPKADKVKFIRDEGRYEIQSDYGNPAGLKLSYSAKTGTFKGSFKVYAVTEAGAAKSFTASVTGAVLDGKGLGTAVIKTIGSVPVTIERRRTEETVQ